jgi:hypothetical protein
MESHSCKKGVPKNMCVECVKKSEADYEAAKRRTEDESLLFAAPEIHDQIKAQIEAARKEREEENKSAHTDLFYSIKRREEREMLEELERQKESPPKKLTWKEQDELRKKYPAATYSVCPATADKAHTWGPMETVGQSWHGPVLSKTCTSCAYNWCNH